MSLSHRLLPSLLLLAVLGGTSALAAAGFRVGEVELDAIEAGGGSLRCCVGEIF